MQTSPSTGISLKEKDQQGMSHQSGERSGNRIGKRNLLVVLDFLPVYPIPPIIDSFVELQQNDWWGVEWTSVYPCISTHQNEFVNSLPT